MANFQRIEVFFGAPNQPESRKIVVGRDESVQAIFLHKNASKFLKDFDKVPKEKGNKAPKGITFVGATEGPADVCYLVGGTLHCWDRSA